MHPYPKNPAPCLAVLVPYDPSPQRLFLSQDSCSSYGCDDPERGDIPSHRARSCPVGNPGLGLGRRGLCRRRGCLIHSWVCMYLCLLEAWSRLGCYVAGVGCRGHGHDRYGRFCCRQSCYSLAHPMVVVCGLPRTGAAVWEVVLCQVLIRFSPKRVGGAESGATAPAVVYFRCDNCLGILEGARSDCLDDVVHDYLLPHIFEIG